MSVTSARDSPYYNEQHPFIVMAKLHSDPSKIAPTWTKVSTTAWDGKTKLTGGYGGRSLQGTSISNDAPHGFLHPERVPEPKNPRMDPLAASISRSSKEKVSHSASYVLPGGESVRSTPLPDKYRSFPFGNQMLIDPMVSNSKNKNPIQWGSTPNSSARDLRQTGAYQESTNNKQMDSSRSSRSQMDSSRSQQPSSRSQPQWSSRSGLASGRDTGRGESSTARTALNSGRTYNILSP